MLDLLLRASLDGAISVAVVWTLIRVLPRLSAATCAFLWWCAAAKFIVALVWTAPVPLRILPPDTVIRNALVVTTRVELTQPTPSSASTGTTEPGATTPARGGWYVAALVIIWTGGFLLAAGIGARRWRRTDAMLKRSWPASHDIQITAADLASRLGLRLLPDVRVSDQLETPLVTGLTRPVVLLPAGRFDALSDRQQRMALCHELAHVKRADLWFGCAPAIAERVFFFHPLAYLAAREYAVWREAACDATVIEILDAAPQEYGRLLLDLGVSRGQATLAAAGASWSFVNLKRRLIMLRDPSTPSTASRLLAATAVCISLLASVPLQLAARRASPVTTGENTPQRDVAPREESGQRKEQDLNFVLFVADDHTTTSGSLEDIKRARRFKRPGEQVMWFRHAGREYVIRDPDVLRQVEAIWMPVNVLGDEQGKVGGRQGELGARQGELGAKQGEIGAHQGRLGARQGVLGELLATMAAQAAWPPNRYKDYKGNERLKIEAEMRALEREMRNLDDKIRELDKPMRDLDEQMEVLSKEMEILSTKMEGAVREAETEMRALLERAIASGVAEAVR